MQILQKNEIVVWAKQSDALIRRDIVSDIVQFMQTPFLNRIGVLYGLRRTGKTTLLQHTFLSLDNIREKSVVFLLKHGDSSAQFELQVEKFYREGITTFYIDEFISMTDYVDTAEDLANKYASLGLKFLISGTHSTGFNVLFRDKWRDRYISFDTTYIPYAEWQKLVKNKHIDSYLLNGGILSPMENAYTGEPQSFNRGFSTVQSTISYIDDSVCNNICHSLSIDESRFRYPLLKRLHEKGKAVPLIQRVILDECHKILYLDTNTIIPGELTGFCNAFFKILEKETETSIPDVKKKKILKELGSTFGFTNDISEKYDEVIALELYDYLKTIQLIFDYQYKLCYRPFENKNNIINTERLKKKKELYLQKIEQQCDIYNDYHLLPQPGLRTSIVIATIKYLMNDQYISSLFESKKSAKEYFINTIQKMMGHMLEECIIFDTQSSIQRHQQDFSVYKVLFENGEYDMCVENNKTNECGIYEIKHRATIDFATQAYHLVDQEKERLFEADGRVICSRTVLYLGKNEPIIRGVRYRNIEDFLRESYATPAFLIRSPDMQKNIQKNIQTDA